MYLTDLIIRAAEEAFGKPQVMRVEQPISREEAQMIRKSRKFQRSHDVTMFIFNRHGRLAVIRKPVFPEGVYRAPSGGVDPGESIEEGALREAMEETGLRIRLHRYLLRVEARFYWEEQEEPWTSYVFYATTEDEHLDPHDDHEIAEARWMTIDELMGPIREALLAAGRPLFQYRVKLTDETVRLLRVENLLSGLS